MAKSTKAVKATKAPKAKAVPTDKKKKRVASKPGLRNLTVKLADIELSEDWNRCELGDISGLIASLEKQGQVVPIIVMRGSTSKKYLLVDGRRRLAAFQEMGATTIKVSYSTAKTVKDARSQAATANLARKPNTPYENAILFEKMSTIDGMSNEEIAQQNDMSPGYVSQHLAVCGADPLLQEGLKNKQVALAVFRQFAKLDQIKDAEIYNSLMIKALDKLPAQAVGDKIDAYLAQKREKAIAEAKKGGAKATKSPAKKGGAAHKKTKAKTKLSLPDYHHKKIFQRIKPRKKAVLVEYLDTYREKAMGATTARNREKYLNILLGLEISATLQGEGS